MKLKIGDKIKLKNNPDFDLGEVTSTRGHKVNLLNENKSFAISMDSADPNIELVESVSEECSRKTEKKHRAIELLSRAGFVVREKPDQKAIDEAKEFVEKEGLIVEKPTQTQTLP